VAISPEAGSEVNFDKPLETAAYITGAII